MSAIKEFLFIFVAATLTLTVNSTTVSADEQPPFSLPPAHKVKKLKSAEIRTNKGTLFFELFPEQAPWHVANFKYRADKNLYRGVPFHLFYPGYIIQGGRTLSGASDPGYKLPAEFSSRSHTRGSLGMARFEDAMNPQRSSSGSQFHIILRDSPHMNGAYTVFGTLVKGWEVLDILQKDDVILGITVYVRNSKTRPNLKQSKAP